MFDDNHPDLNLAETAPMHLDDDVFDGLLDYAVSANAHDVDDSIVPVDSPADAVADDDLDSIALADDADDPLDSPADDSPATAGNGHGGLDGDGEVDARAYDFDGDGMADSILYDTTGNGEFDTRHHDFDGDGVVDSINVDPSAM